LKFEDNYLGTSLCSDGHCKEDCTSAGGKAPCDNICGQGSICNTETNECECPEGLKYFLLSCTISLIPPVENAFQEFARKTVFLAAINVKLESKSVWMDPVNSHVKMERKSLVKVNALVEVFVMKRPTLASVHLEQHFVQMEHAVAILKTKESAMVNPMVNVKQARDVDAMIAMGCRQPVVQVIAIKRCLSCEKNSVQDLFAVKEYASVHLVGILY
jgi:hypothetical protein